MQYPKLTYLEKVIHEMSAPIQTVHLLSEVMLQNQDSFSKINEENLRHIRYAAEKLRKMLNLLSSITNLKSDKVDLKLEEVDLIELAQQEIKYHQVRNKRNEDLKIVLNSKVANCLTMADKFWLKQLRANLLINAINHCDKGLIEVCADVFTKDGDNYFRLSVNDEGCGIAENELETIFLPLRGSHSIGKTPGSGIGLAIAREVTEVHGGNIQAQNNERGGATFEVLIPLK